jgi:hypothetical protein
VSLYGVTFAGKTTASGERFDPAALTMAHRTQIGQRGVIADAPDQAINGL